MVDVNGFHKIERTNSGTFSANTLSCRLPSSLVLAASPNIIAAGCPFCNTMLTDGVKHFNKEGEVQVKDVAELIAEAGEL